MYSRGKSEVLHLAKPIQFLLDFLAKLENRDGINDNNVIQEDPQTERGEPKEQYQDSQKSTIMSDDHTEQPTLASENEMEAECDEDEHTLHIQAQTIKIVASIVKCSFDQLCKFHFLLNTSMLLFLKNKPSIQNSETICFKKIQSLNYLVCGKTNNAALVCLVKNTQ